MKVKIKCLNCGKVTVMDYGDFMDEFFICYCGSTKGKMVKEKGEEEE